MDDHERGRAGDPARGEHGLVRGMEPTRDPLSDGSDLPAANALRALAGLAGRTLLRRESGRKAVGGRRVDGEDAIVLLANLHDDDRTVRDRRNIAR